jgi:hypothetical protein
VGIALTADAARQNDCDTFLDAFSNLLLGQIKRVFPGRSQQLFFVHAGQLGHLVERGTFTVEIDIAVRAFELSSNFPATRDS